MTAVNVGQDTLRIIERLVDLNAKIADLTAEAESLKAELRVLPAGEYDAGGHSFKIIPTRRFDADAAMLLLPAEARPECLTVVADPVKIKRRLTPDQLETCMVEHGRPKVVIP